MGALPKKKLTKARQGGRSAHFALKAPSLSRCPECNSPRRPHRACPVCGSYRGRKVLDIEPQS